MPALFNFILALLLSAPALAASCLDKTEPALNLGHQMKQSGQYLLATQQYSIVMNFACSEDEKAQGLLGYAQSLYFLGETFTATRILENLKSSAASVELKTKARLLAAWYEPEFRKALPENEKRQFQDYHERKLQLEKQHQQKNPWTAGILSAVIPGLGQVYNGSYQSAAFSFVLNSLFLATALELDRQNLKTSALAAGVIFSVTYTGNILSTVSSAQATNRHHLAPDLDEQRKKSLPGLEL